MTLEDDEIKSIDDLMEKRATDEERRLTSELYKSALARIQKGLEDENYFDVICLSQSIMNERVGKLLQTCLLYTSPSPRDLSTSRMPSSA